MSIEPIPESVNIPYILNGELFEIRNRKGESVTVKCCSCPVDRMYRGSIRSTGNFHMHIKRKHPELLGRLHELKVNALLVRQRKIIKRRKSVQRIRTRTRKGGMLAVKQNLHEAKIIPIHKQEAQEPFPNSWNTPLDYSNKPNTPAPELNKVIQKKVPEKIPIVTQIHSNLEFNGVDLTRNAPSVKSEFSYNDNYGVLDLSKNSSNLNVPTTTTNPANMLCHQIALADATTKWVDILSRVETSLKGVEREMRIRNQIETNRLFFDLAKFKYLHPNFDYQS